MRSILTALCVALAAVNAADAQPVPTATPEGASWRLVEGTGLTAAAVSALERPVTVRFEDGRVSGFSGCNTFTGGYTREGDRLRTGQLASTMMACPEPVMAVERAFTRALTGAALAVTLTGDRLALTAEAGARLTFVRAPADTPVGGTWEVTGYNNGRQAVVGPMNGTRLTVAFEPGTVSGEAGCNTFRGTATIDGGRITIGPLATSRKACEAAVMTQEGEFLRALGTANAWSIDAAGLLHLHRPDGERVLVAGPRRR